MKFWTRWRFPLCFTLVFWAASLYIYRDILSYWFTITSPDDGPMRALAVYTQYWESVLSGQGTLIPPVLRQLTDFVGWHQWYYAIDTFLIGASVAFYLRSLRIAPAAAYSAGLFAGFCGYFASLFSAGHLGILDGYALGMWQIGLISLGFGTRRWAYFALYGCFACWGQMAATDVGALCIMLGAAFVIWQFVKRLLRREPAAELFRVYVPRLALAAVVFLLVGNANFFRVIQSQRATRDQQISESSRPAAASTQQSPEAAKQKAEDRWIFATNWSLAPADCLEFAVAGVFGNDSFRPPYPFWGELGRPYGFKPGQMWPNYRQHTVYMGLFALFFAGVAVFSRRRKSAAEPDDADTDDVPFWIAVWVGALLLALGRYTPVYRLFYAIPLMDYLRAPVKFLHFTEYATAVLAGFGLMRLLKNGLSKRILWSAGIVTGLLVLAALIFAVNGPAIEKHIAWLGYGQAGAALRDYAVYNCWRTVGLSAVLFGLLAGWYFKRSPVFLYVIVLVGVADLASVASRYVIPVQVKPFYAENAILRDLKTATDGLPAVIANYATRNVYGQDFLNTAFEIHGFHRALPDENDPNAPFRSYALAAQNNPEQFWQAAGVRFILIPREQAMQLARNPGFRFIGEYELGNGTVRKVRNSEKSVVLFERLGSALPAVFGTWTGNVPKEQQKDAQSFPVSDAPGRTGAVRGKVVFSQMRGNGSVGIYSTRAVVESDGPGLLVWPEKYDPVLCATLNGKEIKLFSANNFWCAVEVPAGKNELVCRVRPSPWLNLLSGGTALCVLLAACWTLRR